MTAMICGFRIILNGADGPMTRHRYIGRKAGRTALSADQLGLEDLLVLKNGWSTLNNKRRTKLRTIPDLRQAWALNRDLLLTVCSCDGVPPLCGENHLLRRKPGERPWAWWTFESPEPRQYDEPECEQLRRMGVFTAQEAALLAKRAWEKSGDLVAQHEANLGGDLAGCI